MNLLYVCFGRGLRIELHFLEFRTHRWLPSLISINTSSTVTEVLFRLSTVQ